jgi:hypothetical protein
MAWPLRAAQSLWNLGKRPFAGTGWRGGAKGIPGQPGQAAIPPGAPGTRLPPGGRLNTPYHTVAGPRSRKGGHTQRTKVYPPSAKTAGARPAVPGSPAIPAGIARRRPVATAAVLGGAGLVGSSLLPDGTPDPTYEPRGGGGLGGVPPIGLPPVGDTFQSQLPGLVQRRQQERDSFLNNMQTVLGHSILLSFQNPGRESKYVENAMALLAGDAKARGAIDDAKIIEEVFKDKKVPKSAKVIYNRLVKHVGPKKAAEVSGYTLEIDKAEAKAATDFLKAQKALQENIGPKSVRLNQILALSEIDFDAAVAQLAGEWSAGGTLQLPEAYGGYEGNRSIEEFMVLARDFLSKQTGGGPSGAGTNAEVMDIQVQ